MRSIRHIPDIQANRSSVVCALLLAGGMLLNFVPALTLADQPLSTMTAGYPSGTITAVYQQMALQIDGRTYKLTPDVVLLDRHGDPLEERHLRVDIGVKYHLLKGTTDKIDQMILFLPE